MNAGALGRVAQRRPRDRTTVGGDLEPLVDREDVDFLRVAIVKHATFTGSRYAEELLADWASVIQRFVRSMPRDYKKALAAEAKRKGEARIDRVTLVTASAQAGQASAEQALHG